MCVIASWNSQIYINQVVLLACLGSVNHIHDEAILLSFTSTLIAHATH